MKRLLAVVFVFSIPLFCLAQDQKNVLFLGNSYTYTHNVPNTTKLLAQSNGDILKFDSHTPGGYRLNQHATNTTSLQKIRNTNWDHVVLQDQSLTPAYNFSGFYSGAKALIEEINNGSCTNNTILFMTWGRKNNATYPYKEMQKRTTDNYNKVADAFETEISPVGVAWKKVRDDKDPVNLYSGDGSHQSFAGTYLAACVFYATIFDKSPVGLAYRGSLSAADALYLQNKAFEAYNEYVALNRIHTSSNEDVITDVYTGKINHTEAELSKLVTNCCLKTNFNLNFSGKKPSAQATTEIKYRIYQNAGLVTEESKRLTIDINPTICNKVSKNFPLNINLTAVNIGTFYLDLYLNDIWIASYTLQKSSTLNVHEIADTNVKIAPNPTTDFLYFNNLNRVIQVSVIDTKGSTVLDASINNNKLDVRSLTNGIYILKIKNSTVNYKFIKS